MKSRRSRSNRSQTELKRTSRSQTATLRSWSDERKGAEGTFGPRVPTFSPEKVRECVEAGICPWCGAGPYKVLAGHTQKMHGVDRLELRDLAGLTYSTSITPPEVREKNASRARQARKDGVFPRYEGPKKKRRLSKEAQKVARDKILAASTDETRRKAHQAAHTPEAKAKRSESVRNYQTSRRGRELQHGDLGKYQSGCRCEACTDANRKSSAEQSERRALRSGGCKSCGHARDEHASRVGRCSVDGCGCSRWRLRAPADGQREIRSDLDRWGQ